VITLGPADKFNERKYYKELLGISSHELYHTWNVKDVRPSDWTPYDFTKPNYSRLGYVAEGVTTYMGDYMLWQGRAFSDEEFLEEMSNQVQKHMDNEGRFNLSLADSSIDTWIDGYGRGVPRRRVSIYTEGALLALTCDLWILSKTHGERDLNTVMRSLFEKYGGQKGFTEEEYWAELKAAADLPWDDLREKVLDGRGHLIGFVRNALAKVGLEIDAQPSSKTWRAAWGVSFAVTDGNWKVWNVMENSPAEKAGFWFDDEVIEIGGEKPDVFFENPDRALADSVAVTLQSGFRTKNIEVNKDGHVWLQRFTIRPMIDGDYPLFDIWKTAVNKDLSQS
jgi:predicted metalloprotease with PDZ domain